MESFKNTFLMNTSLQNSQGFIPPKQQTLNRSPQLQRERYIRDMQAQQSAVDQDAIRDINSATNLAEYREKLTKYSTSPTGIVLNQVVYDAAQIKQATLEKAAIDIINSSRNFDEYNTNVARFDTDPNPENTLLDAAIYTAAEAKRTNLINEEVAKQDTLDKQALAELQTINNSEQYNNWLSKWDQDKSTTSKYELSSGILNAVRAKETDLINKEIAEQERIDRQALTELQTVNTAEQYDSWLNQWDQDKSTPTKYELSSGILGAAQTKEQVLNMQAQAQVSMGESQALSDLSKIVKESDYDAWLRKWDTDKSTADKYELSANLLSAARQKEDYFNTQYNKPVAPTVTATKILQGEVKVTKSSNGVNVYNYNYLDTLTGVNMSTSTITNPATDPSVRKGTTAPPAAPPKAPASIFSPLLSKTTTGFDLSKLLKPTMTMPGFVNYDQPIIIPKQQSIFAPGASIFAPVKEPGYVAPAFYPGISAADAKKLYIKDSATVRTTTNQLKKELGLAINDKLPEKINLDAYVADKTTGTLTTKGEKITALITKVNSDVQVANASANLANRQLEWEVSRGIEQPYEYTGPVLSGIPDTPERIAAFKEIAKEERHLGRQLAPMEEYMFLEKPTPSEFIYKAAELGNEKMDKYGSLGDQLFFKPIAGVVAGVGGGVLSFAEGAIPWKEYNILASGGGKKAAIISYGTRNPLATFVSSTGALITNPVEVGGEMVGKVISNPLYEIPKFAGEAYVFGKTTGPLLEVAGGAIGETVGTSRAVGIVAGQKIYPYLEPTVTRIGTAVEPITTTAKAYGAAAKEMGVEFVTDVKAAKAAVGTAAENVTAPARLSYNLAKENLKYNVGSSFENLKGRYDLTVGPINENIGEYVSNIGSRAKLSIESAKMRTIEPAQEFVSSQISKAQLGYEMKVTPKLENIGAQFELTKMGIKSKAIEPASEFLSNQFSKAQYGYQDVIVPRLENIGAQFELTKIGLKAKAGDVFASDLYQKIKQNVKMETPQESIDYYLRMQNLKTGMGAEAKIAGLKVKGAALKQKVGTAVELGKRKYISTPIEETLNKYSKPIANWNKFWQDVELAKTRKGTTKQLVIEEPMRGPTEEYTAMNIRSPYEKEMALILKNFPSEFQGPGEVAKYTGLPEYIVHASPTTYAVRGGTVSAAKGSNITRGVAGEYVPGAPEVGEFGSRFSKNVPVQLSPKNLKAQIEALRRTNPNIPQFPGERTNLTETEFASWAEKAYAQTKGKLDKEKLKDIIARENVFNVVKTSDDILTGSGAAKILYEQFPRTPGDADIISKNPKVSIEAYATAYRAAGKKINIEPDLNPKYKPFGKYMIIDKSLKDLEGRPLKYLEVERTADSVDVTPVEKIKNRLETGTRKIDAKLEGKEWVFRNTLTGEVIQRVYQQLNYTDLAKRPVQVQQGVPITSPRVLIKDKIEMGIDAMKNPSKSKALIDVPYLTEGRVTAEALTKVEKVPQGYIYYAGLGEQASLYEALSGKAKIGGWPSVKITRGVIEKQAPDILKIKNTPIQKWERIEFNEYFDRLESPEYKGSNMPYVMDLKTGLPKTRMVRVKAKVEGSPIIKIAMVDTKVPLTVRQHILDRYGQDQFIEYIRSNKYYRNLQADIAPAVAAPAKIRSEYETEILPGVEQIGKTTTPLGKAKQIFGLAEQTITTPKGKNVGLYFTEVKNPKIITETERAMAAKAALTPTQNFEISKYMYSQDIKIPKTMWESEVPIDIKKSMIQKAPLEKISPYERFLVNTSRTPKKTFYVGRYLGENIPKLSLLSGKSSKSNTSSFMSGYSGLSSGVSSSGGPSSKPGSSGGSSGGTSSGGSRKSNELSESISKSLSRSLSGSSGSRISDISSGSSSMSTSASTSFNYSSGFSGSSGSSITPPPETPPYLPRETSESKSKQYAKAYDVYVRKGIEPETGKRRKVGEVLVKRGLPYNAAANLGMGIAAEYAQRTAILKPSRYKSTMVDERLNTGLLTEFRPLKLKSKIPRSKQDRVFVEKSKYAINTRAEKLGIPYKAAALKRSRSNIYGSFGGMRV